MRSWLSPWPMRRSGLLLLVGVSLGCGGMHPSLEPYAGEPFFTSEARLEEYEALACIDQPVGCKPQAPKTRAWIREADRVIRSNNVLQGDL
jgi:hypothetical protein